jgi:hypothetical protein
LAYNTLIKCITTATANLGVSNGLFSTAKMRIYSAILLSLQLCQCEYPDICNHWLQGWIRCFYSFSLCISKEMQRIPDLFWLTFIMQSCHQLDISFNAEFINFVLKKMTIHQQINRILKYFSPNLSNKVLMLNLKRIDERNLLE